MRIFIVGIKSKRLLFSLFLLFLAGMVFAVPPPDLELPVFSGDSNIVGEINQVMVARLNTYSNDITTKLNSFLPADDFNNLAGGFANASVFSSDGASQRGYEGYKAFSFTVGFMGAIQLPQLTLFDKITDVFDNGDEKIGPDLLKDLMGIPFGLDFQVLNAQLGINASFLLRPCPLESTPVTS